MGISKEDKSWAHKRGEICVDGAIYPIQQRETEAASDLQPLSLDMHDKIDTQYTISDDGVKEKATPFEQVKGFSPGENILHHTSKVDVGSETKLCTSVEIIDQPDITCLEALSKERMNKEVAANISTAETINEPTVSYRYCIIN